jgi:L-ascorbate metabolism protein UlaG (beta-lactamase superfamily)
MKITYIGGPTAIIEMGALRFITDPTFDPGGSKAVSGGLITAVRLTFLNPNALSENPSLS